MSAQAWVSLVFAIGVVLIIGLRCWRRTTAEAKDFYLGGRTFGTWRSGISAFAAGESSWAFLGLVGLAYSQGVVVAWILVGVVYGYLGTWVLMAPGLRRLSVNHDALTIPQLIAVSAGRYRRSVSAFASVVLVVALMLYIAVQFNVVGEALYSMAGIPMKAGIVIGAIVIGACSIAGGVRSVSNTGVLQGIMMVLALAFLACASGLQVAHGGSLISQLRAISPRLVNPFGGDTGRAATLTVLFYCSIGLGLTGAPHFLRKFITAAPTSSCFRAGLISVSSCLLLFTFAIATGLAGRVLFPNLSAPDTLFVALTKGYLPGEWGLVGGILIASILGASASTATAQMLEATASFTEDGSSARIYGKSKLSPRWVMTFVGLVGLVVALVGNETIFDRTLTAWAFLGAVLGPQLVLAALRIHLAGIGILVGMITSAAVVLVWECGFPLVPGVYSLLPGFFLGLLTTLLVSLFAPSAAPQNERTKQADP